MKSISIDEFIDSSISANKKIYHLINTSEDKFKEQTSLGYGGDISLQIDLKAEEIFINELSSYGKVFSEESGLVGSGELTIVVDPIDGSDNFRSNFPYFGSSIAIKSDSEVFAGIITNFANGEIFIKTKDSFKRGFLDSKSFVDVKKNSLSRVGIFERGYKSEKYSKKLKQKGIKYRVPGAFALSLAYARDVDFVLFEGEIREFDVCAGRFMCEDLYLYESEDTFLVSKDRDMFEKLRDMI